MNLIILLIFFIWGWIEISAFIVIGSEVGVVLTILGVFVTAMIGVSLLKSQGRAVMNSLRTDIAQGRPPMKSVADSIGLLCGAVLMLLPGYVTDAIGLALFLPGIRTVAGLWLATRLGKSARFTSYAGAAHAGSSNHNSHFGPNSGSRHQQSSSTPNRHQWDNNDIIEGEAEDKTPDQGSTARKSDKKLK
ncbi:FxsA family protein [Candidatus Puniceispirillum sp.]|uniref:FxsA family protein n=1 Tax=Candidatus Puniceispirillum sp. TaxID=2026719 RepID=UPI003F69E847